ncbi:hypothetical protein GCM10010911_11200 [Paenibacillus nasutitermitis]|uniref:Thioredoxin domain-containing protein n=2 Tax=Paenibacillus nasutitermitis TaxID=1652958 RepID=A0A916YR17_9BACL|nr:hypothetical protein GCM10010911_11200 [Paenibacillus nasutitermitis]
MVGFVSSIDLDNRNLTVDISEWEKRHTRGPDINDYGVELQVQLTPSVNIHKENGDSASASDLRVGQKVELKPAHTKSSKEPPKEIIILTIRQEEALERLGLFARGKGSIHVTILGDESSAPLNQKIMDQFLNEAGSGLQGGVSSMMYQPEYIVDLKKIYGIQRFPTILLFDQEKLLLQTEDVGEAIRYITAKNKS